MQKLICKLTFLTYFLKIIFAVAYIFLFFWGNALYGKTITNEEKHTGTTYCIDGNTTPHTNNPLFQCMHKITDTTYEITNHTWSSHTNRLLCVQLGEDENVGFLLQLPGEILRPNQIWTVADGHGLTVFRDMRRVCGRYFKARNVWVLLQGLPSLAALRALQQLQSGLSQGKSRKATLEYKALLCEVTQVWQAYSRLVQTSVSGLRDCIVMFQVVYLCEVNWQ